MKKTIASVILALGLAAGAKAQVSYWDELPFFWQEITSPEASTVPVQSIEFTVPNAFSLSGSPCASGACQFGLTWADVAKGQILAGSGTELGFLAAGTNAFVLTADSTQTYGIKWAAAAATGAPADGDYLVGTSNGSLSAEIVVGTSPGGELGGTWASPTIDDSVTVASWTCSSCTLTSPVMTYTKKISLIPEQATFLASAFPQVLVTAGTNFPVSGLAYDTTTEEAAFWKFIAADYASGNLTLKVYWYADTSTTSAATVEWEASITAITGDADTTNIETDTLATSNVQSDSLGSTDAQKLNITTVTISNLDSIAAADLVFIRLSRNISGTDDMAGDAIMVQAELSYTATYQ